MYKDYRILHFFDTYTEALAEVANKYPKEYPWIGSSLTVQMVSDRLQAAVREHGIGSVDYRARAFKLTCKRLLIPHTKIGMENFLNL